MGLFDRWTGKHGRNEAKAEAGLAADPALEGIDPRVASFLADFEQRRFGLTPAGAVDYPVCREAVLDLHARLVDERSRVALLRFYAALMGTGVEALRREGRDPAELQRLWRSDYFSMLAKEAIDGAGNVDPEALAHLNRREQEAGRLAPGEVFHLQQTQAADLRADDGVRSAREVGERAIALWTVVLASIAPGRRETVISAFAAEGAREWLAEAELEFLRSPEPNPSHIVAFGWQAERLVVLLWALGLAELPAHDEKCDPLRAAALVPPTAGLSFEAFLDGLRLRAAAEIQAVAADINDSYWTAHRAEAAGQPRPPGVDLEILDERLRAAAWLIGQQLPEWP
jgi:Domain of unknown function (DUF4272)